MDATTKKSGYQGTASHSGTRKRSGAKYTTDIRTAYDMGYAKGWDDAYAYPKRFGSQSAAAYGYKKGMRNRHRVDKYTKQYQRQGKKYS